jgi:hypothetical protein
MADYAEGWQQFRRLRNIWLLILAAELSPISDALESFFYKILRPSDPAYVVVGVQFVFGVALVLIGNHLWKWKCPRCSKLFAGGYKVMDKLSTSLNWLFLPKQCVSCGLPRYSTNPEATSSQGPI